ncbi:MAG: RsmE family RNA methyltransferase [Candidatus Izemoplasmatales bacterium]
MQRYFINQSQIHDQTVKITDGDFHHIKNVMRKKVNDEVIVNTYDGHVYLCKITGFDPQEVVLEIIKAMDSSKNDFNLVLGLSLTKKDNFEMAIKKATELGVSGFIPIETDRSVVKIKDFQKKKERFTLLAKESSEQSERTTLPKIYDLQTIESLDLENFDHLFVAYARKDKQALKSYLSKIKRDDYSLVLIGPEGGFTEKEIKTLVDKGFETISLGNTILRAETAAIYITSIFRYMLGD